MLTGRIWRLTKLGGVDRKAVGITATFTDSGRISGFSGCNNYSGTFTTAGDSIDVSDRLVVTMRACAEPLMRAESAFLAALSSAGTYAVRGGSLKLFDRQGRAVAEFAVESQSLARTSWTVLSYNNGKQAVVSVIARTRLTARFGQSGDLTGSAGCNDYRAAFKSAPPRISVGPVASTRKYCPRPAGVRPGVRLPGRPRERGDLQRAGLDARAPHLARRARGDADPRLSRGAKPVPGTATPLGSPSGLVASNGHGRRATCANYPSRPASRQVDC